MFGPILASSIEAGGDALMGFVFVARFWTFPKKLSGTWDLYDFLINLAFFCSHFGIFYRSRWRRAHRVCFCGPILDFS